MMHISLVLKHSHPIDTNTPTLVTKISIDISILYTSLAQPVQAQRVETVKQLTVEEISLNSKGCAINLHPMSTGRWWNNQTRQRMQNTNNGFCAPKVIGNRALDSIQRFKRKACHCFFTSNCSLTNSATLKVYNFGARRLTGK